MTRKCPICGKKFTPNPARPRQLYCSRHCKALANNRAASGRKSARLAAKRKPVACPICGKEFMPAKVNQKCCSHECSRRYWHRVSIAQVTARRAEARGVRKCEWCGKEFAPKHSNARFCSQSCCHASSYNQRKGAAVSARNRAESDENSIARVQAYLSLPTEERYARRDMLTAKERILARDMWLRMKSPFAAYERRYA